jgi:DNA (cytosine-5)-methyltransferase 1
MIFEGFINTKDKKKAAFYREKINLYIRIVEVYCEDKKIKLLLATEPNDKILNEILLMGVISSKKEIVNLESFLGKNDFARFISAVYFVTNNRKLILPLVYKLYNSERKKIQQTNDINKNPKIADFFCGAGGLSLGFIKEGFAVKLANDHEEVCIETYKFNHPEIPAANVIQGDIRKLVENIGDYLKENSIDIVVGGPPCQGFSSANQQRIIDDPRNELYKYFIKAIENIAPKFVVMENVRGMLPYANQVVEDYHKIKIKSGKSNLTYDAAYRLFNSQNFSVAQSRQRLIYIAIRSDIAAERKITPEQLFAEIESTYSNSRKFNLRDALESIKSLEAPREKNMNEVDSDITGKKVDLNIVSKTNAYLRLINENKNSKIIFNHKARYANDINYEIYNRLEQGEDATNSKIQDIMPYSHRNHVFKDKYYKLIADKPSRTITAHLRMDCHSHIHPFQARAITPREAARIQSFPDDYVFLGAYLKTYMQIGNAVPPLMAKGIASVIKKYI